MYSLVEAILAISSLLSHPVTVSQDEILLLCLAQIPDPHNCEHNKMLVVLTTKICGGLLHNITLDTITLQNDIYVSLMLTFTCI